MAGKTLPALRESLHKLNKGRLSGAPSLFASGFAEMDAFLAGGLARGALHDIYAQEPADAVSAMGFAASLALRAADRRTILWVRQDFLDLETGRLHAAGLAELGLDPGNMIFVHARTATDALRAGAEAIRCSALGAVIIDVWGQPAALDLTASRRLSLASAASGVTSFLMRVVAPPSPSAASTRWSVRTASSAALAANAPGHSAFIATLLRHRSGLASRGWHLEWDRDQRCFRNGSSLSFPVAAVPCDRQAAPRKGIDRLERAA